MRYFLFILILVFSFFCNGATVNVKTGLLCTKERLKQNCGDTTNNYFTSCCLDGLRCADRPCAGCCNKRDSLGFQSCLWNTTSSTCGNFVCADTLACSARLNESCCTKTPQPTPGCSWINESCKAKCPFKKINNCDLSAGTKHGQRSGSCSNSYINGSCSYTCNNGEWTQNTNTCAQGRSCTGKTENNCIVPGIGHNQSSTSNTCNTGYAGGCDYSCSNGTMTISNHSCTRQNRGCSVRHWMAFCFWPGYCRWTVSHGKCLWFVLWAGIEDRAYDNRHTPGQSCNRPMFRTLNISHFEKRCNNGSWERTGRQMDAIDCRPGYWELFVNPPGCKPCPAGKTATAYDCK